MEYRITSSPQPTTRSSVELEAGTHLTHGMSGAHSVEVAPPLSRTLITAAPSSSARASSNHITSSRHIITEASPDEEFNALEMKKAFYGTHFTRVVAEIEEKVPLLATLVRERAFCSDPGNIKSLTNDIGRCILESGLRELEKIASLRETALRACALKAAIHVLELPPRELYKDKDKITTAESILHHATNLIDYIEWSNNTYTDIAFNNNILVNGELTRNPNYKLREQLGETQRLLELTLALAEARTTENPDQIEDLTKNLNESQRKADTLLLRMVDSFFIAYMKYPEMRDGAPAAGTVNFMNTLIMKATAAANKSIYNRTDGNELKAQEFIQVTHLYIHTIVAKMSSLPKDVLAGYYEKANRACEMAEHINSASAGASASEEDFL